MSIVLVFSRAEARVLGWSAKEKRFKGAPKEVYGQALDDDGNLLPCTGFFNDATDPETRGFLKKKYPDVELTKVSEKRVVVNFKGEPVNQDRWKEWGYTPE